MDDCLHELTEKKECKNDEILVAMVRLRLIVEKSRSTPWQNTDSRVNDGLGQPSQTLYARVLHTELRRVSEMISSDLIGDGKLRVATQ